MTKMIVLALLFIGGPMVTSADAVDLSATAVVSPAPVSATASPLKVKKKKSGKAAVKGQSSNPAHAKVSTLALSVTEEGFVPAVIKVKKGEPINLVITRRTEQTCAREIIIPDYNLAQRLPLNEPVTIALTPRNSGEIRYSCGMGMIRGVLSVE